MQSKARAALRIAADLIWPPVSPLSGDAVDRPGALTGADFAKLHFIAPPLCARCGVPFDYPAYEGMACAPCSARPPVWEIARSALVYDAASRALPLALKHAGRTDMVAAYGRWMARAGADALAGADLLIPVPLHASRLRRRRFNQSLLLARAVARESGVAVDPHVLLRTRRTGTQGGLTAKSRTRNVAGAFTVPAAARARVAGARLVIVDDVHTTGATLSACVRTLKRAGAAHVNALTLARVVKPVSLLK
ncbi:MAG: ComF family protein [Oceanicaulis sp.]